MLFKDKVVIVTGAGSGIGFAAAEKFLAEGAKVLAFDKKIAGCEPLEDWAQKYYTEVQIVEGDVSSLKDIRTLFTWLKKTWNKLDILVNNAGVSKHQPFEKVSEADFDKTIGVDLKGTFFMAQEAAKMMNKGAIVNVASVEGLVGYTTHADYVAAKSAVIGLTRALALDLAPDIRVNAVAPGPTETPMTEWATKDPSIRRKRLSEIPMSRFGKPEEIAEAILWLASGKASFCTGSVLVVDGGLSAK